MLPQKRSAAHGLILFVPKYPQVVPQEFMMVTVSASAFTTVTTWSMVLPHSPLFLMSKTSSELDKNLNCPIEKM